jgi:hypothetical protein
MCTNNVHVLLSKTGFIEISFENKPFLYLLKRNYSIRRLGKLPGNQLIIIHDYPLFSSPDPKGQVSYCHHLASVVVIRRKLFQKSSPLKVLDQWKPNLV